MRNCSITKENNKMNVRDYLRYKIKYEKVLIIGVAKKKTIKLWQQKPFLIAYTQKFY
jgi:hypothetical protein